MRTHDRSPESSLPRNPGVLLIEDDDAVARMLSEVLGAGGYEPIVARQRDVAALGVTLDQPGIWHVLIADLDNAARLAERTLELYERRKLDIPFFLLASHIHDKDAALLLRRGVAGIIEKHELPRLVPALEHTFVQRARNAEVETKLRQAQRMEAVGQLAGGIAHDFNNLLTVILSCAKFAEKDPGLSPRTREELAQITRAGARAADLTRQLLAFSRQHVANARTIALSQVFGQIDDLLARSLGDTVSLVLRCSPDIWQVCFDPVLLEQVVLNLALNARDAMPQGGDLVIDCDNLVVGELPLDRPPTELPPGCYARITVSDTGTGMTPEVRERIFEPFFTTKMLGEGTGLGLSTCYGIVKEAGGHFRVYSEPGQGSVFQLYIPAVDANGLFELPGRTLSRVFVVHRNETARVLLERGFRQRGARVWTFADATAAREALSESLHRPDLLVVEADQGERDEPMREVRNPRSGHMVISLIGAPPGPNGPPEDTVPSGHTAPRPRPVSSTLLSPELPARVLGTRARLTGWDVVDDVSLDDTAPESSE